MEMDRAAAARRGPAASGLRRAATPAAPSRGAACEPAGKSMRVLIVTKNYPPISHSGTFRIEAFVRHLPRFGIEPVVVADAKPFSQVDLYSQERPGLGVPPDSHVHAFPWSTQGLGRWETQLQRLPLVNSHVRQKARDRLALAVLGQVRARLRGGDFDLVLSSSPPPEVHFVARAIARHYGVPLVCDLRDPWSHYFGERYRSLLDFHWERLVERRVLSDAAAVIANTSASRALLVDEVGVPESKVVVLGNGFDEERHAGDEGAARYLEPKRFNIVYTGLLSKAESGTRRDFRRAAKTALGLEFSPLHVSEETRSLRFVLRALAELAAESPGFGESAVLHLFGQRADFMEGEVAAFGLGGIVRVHGPVAQPTANGVCGQADLLLLLQVEMFRRGRPCALCIPGKLFNYLRAGRPILAPIQAGEAAEIIEGCEAGVVVPPRDVGAIKRALAAFHADWSRLGRTPSRSRDTSRYDMASITADLARLLRAAAGEPAGKAQARPII